MSDIVETLRERAASIITKIGHHGVTLESLHETQAANEITRLREVNKGLVEAINECAGLFAAIRDDYTDPRSECRAGINTCAAALTAAKD